MIYWIYKEWRDKVNKEIDYKLLNKNMNRYIVIKKLDGYNLNVGDTVCTLGANVIELPRMTILNSTEYQFSHEVTSVGLLLAAGVIISADWKPTKQGEVFYVPNVTNAKGNRFTKHKFSASSECHKRWVDEDMCCYTPEQADNMSEKMIARLKLLP